MMIIVTLQTRWFADMVSLRLLGSRIPFPTLCLSADPMNNMKGIVPYPL